METHFRIALKWVSPLSREVAQILIGRNKCNGLITLRSPQREALAGIYIYTTQRCQIAYSVAKLAGSLAYRPFLTWIGIGLLILSPFFSMDVVDDEWPRDRREPRL